MAVPLDMPPSRPRIVHRGHATKESYAITQVLSHVVIHVLVYAPAAERKEWIERELMIDTTIQVAHDIRELVSVLVGDPRSRPQMLVIDLDALTAGELFHLHQIREHGWCGAIVALGQVPPSLRASLQIAQVIRPVRNALSKELDKYRSATEQRTMPIPVLLDAPDPEHKTYG